MIRGSDKEGAQAPGFRILGWGVVLGTSIGGIQSVLAIRANGLLANGLWFLAVDRLTSLMWRGAALGALAATAWLAAGRACYGLLRKAGFSPQRSWAGAWVTPPLAYVAFVFTLHLNREYLPGFFEPTSVAVNVLAGTLAVVGWWLTCVALSGLRRRTIPTSGKLLAVLVAVSLACLLGAGLARAMWKPTMRAGAPNILLIVVDALRADRLGAYGNPQGLTPNLDRLAQDGVVCKEAYAPSSWTKPSIAALFTSRYPRELGIQSGGWQRRVGKRVEASALPDASVTLAELLRNAGYRTAAFGKNHHLTEVFGFAQGFQVFRMDLEDPDNPEFSAQAIRKHFEAWLADNDEPFFAYLHYIDVHWPYLKPPPPFGGRLAPDGPDLEYNTPEFMERFRSNDLAAVATPDTVRHMRARYDENVAYMDHRLGELFELLRARNAYDNTWIVLTADHGEEFAEHGGLFHGRTLYEEVLRIPLLIKPALHERSLAQGNLDRCTLLDLAPTLLRVVGIAVPGDTRGEVLERGCCGQGRALFAELGMEFAIRQNRYKYLVDLASGREWLFDLATDPLEERALPAGSPSTEHFRELLFQFLDQTRTSTASETRELDDRDLERLRSLGYVE